MRSNCGHYCMRNFCENFKLIEWCRHASLNPVALLLSQVTLHILHYPYVWKLFKLRSMSWSFMWDKNVFIGHGALNIQFSIHLKLCLQFVHHFLFHGLARSAQKLGLATILQKSKKNANFYLNFAWVILSYLLLWGNFNIFWIGAKC